jgi:hypothetical protein
MCASPVAILEAGYPRSDLEPKVVVRGSELDLKGLSRASADCAKQIQRW